MSSVRYVPLVKKQFLTTTHPAFTLRYRLRLKKELSIQHTTEDSTIK
jgi:hypothetical protein